MTDNTIETSKPIPFPDKEMAEQGQMPEQELAEQGAPLVDVPEPVSAVARLRAFEDEHFGKNTVRIRGQVEKGFGSKFKAMPESKHRHYAALEKLVSTEAHLADAHTKLLQAEADHEAALAAADAAESEPDGDE